MTGDALASAGAIGTRVDRYQLERLLGAGGFGSVYLARHVHTGAQVALKLLKKNLVADDEMIERFLREARAAAAVGDEHIVRVTDAGLTPDHQAFLALEYLEGVDLKELATRDAPLPWGRVVQLVLQSLDALSAAHARGIVHRDMKPANVFVIKDRAGNDFVKLLDFGISKIHSEASTAGLTLEGVGMGTPSYMAPEQFFDARSVDQRADLYSVAAMLYELLSGRVPLEAESYAHLILKVRGEQPQALHDVAADVPLALSQVVMTGLAKEPHQRWQTAQAFADALRAAARDATAQAPVAPRPLATPVRVSHGSFEQTHTPSRQPEAPARGGTFVAPLPLAQAAAPVGPQPASPAPPKKDNTLKWILAIVGVLMLGGGCCTCLAIVGVASGG